MLAYAANGPVVVDRRPHPNTLLLIIGAHALVVAAVMTAKMDLPRRLKPEPPITVETIQPTPPPSRNVHPTKPTAPQPITMSDPLPRLPIPPVNPPIAPITPTLDPMPISTGGAAVTPEIPKPVITPVKSGPQLLTSGADLKPPYPSEKLLNEEEAVLTLKLTINESGRVVVVDSVGRADPVFLDAARRHLIAHWRFRPATEDGRAVDSTTVISLHFELNG